MRPLLGLAAPVLILSACASSAPQAAPEAPSDARKLLTLEQTASRGDEVDFRGDLPSYRWAEDGVHLVYVKQEAEGDAEDDPDAKPEVRVWIDPVTWTESAPPTEAESEAADDEGNWKAFLAVGLEEKDAKRVAKRSGTTAENGGVLRKHEGTLYWERDGAVRVLASSQPAPVELEEISPDGERVAFVQANDLILVDTATGAWHAVTGDGSPNVFNGKLDWVYQEEIYGRGDFKAFWWSPDSKHIAFLRLDETEVHEFTVIDHIEDGHFRVKPEISKYPKVGDPNPIVQLGVASTATPSDVLWLDLSSYAKTEPLVVRVDWTPEGDELVYMVQDRIQTWLDLNFADPTTGKVRPFLHETSRSWVNRAPAPRWLEDGSFLWQSERTGQRHVYHYRRDGTLVGAITSGEWSVGRIDEVDEEQGRMWFSATKDGAVNANTYRVNLDGSNLVRLTQGDGRHSVSWNEARTYFLDTFSSLADPSRRRLCAADGDVVRELGVAEIPDLETYATSPWEYHRVNARDGFELDVALLKPVPFDPDRSYPVWIPTYSGPNAPSVRNSWNGSAWYQFLAQNGVIVMQVNVRSASGKGLVTTSTAYKQLGVPELRDLEDAVSWLCANPWANGERVGITGGSYGGFMTAYALTHSTKFALGIAASGVYDWAMYDTVYTERYMSTPERNPEGYANTSVIRAAANLSGHLVITHGVMDDNVHLQNALQLVYELQKAGKDFELMLYPQSRHGIRHKELRWHDRRLAWEAIQEYLIDG